MVDYGVALTALHHQQCESGVPEAKASVSAFQRLRKHLLEVEHVVSRGEDLSNILFRFNESDFAFSHFENLRVDGSDLTEDITDGQFTPNSILEDPAQYNGSSASSTGGRETSGSEAPRKKKSGGGFFPQIVLSLSSRRKGAPHSYLAFPLLPRRAQWMHATLLTNFVSM
ncbi:hypothetical protein ZIOFF_031617 [Zingiber officinale]|uniref:Uncharacterized protein n=1 Tax=Zingiber officinale TaxID=94328 RepID=A0A8J5GEH7_ZINOF|nr:hypothetical protein ZIOFF_031617 [Zingiber officinale]